MKKGALLITKGNAVYKVIRRWDKVIVLMPTSNQEEQVLIYGELELEGLIADVHFRRVHDTGVAK